LCYNRPMPKVGVEPTLPKERDFESRASACSATSAQWVKYSQWVKHGQGMALRKKRNGFQAGEEHVGCELPLAAKLQTTGFSHTPRDEL
jgi:hypothetical protein